MLVFISDLHLTDGTTAVNVDPDAFTILLDDIKQKANRRKATEIHLVLLGDILDFVRTDYWHRNIPQKERRPWNGDLDPATGMNKDTSEVERQFQEVLREKEDTPDKLNGPSVDIWQGIRRKLYA